jgi:hypothetical protein
MGITTLWSNAGIESRFMGQVWAPWNEWLRKVCRAPFRGKVIIWRLCVGEEGDVGLVAARVLHWVDKSIRPLMG